MNTPANWLTLSRLAAALVLPPVFLLPDGDIADKAALIIFIFGALTDFADGFLARKLQTRSQFGAFLDPVADKLLVITALLLLTADARAPVIAVLIIVCREVAVSALREWSAISSGERLTVIAAGKIKTVAQMSAICVLFYNDDFLNIPKETITSIGKGILWASALLSLHSFILYAARAIKIFRK